MFLLMLLGGPTLRGFSWNYSVLSVITDQCMRRELSLAEVAAYINFVGGEAELSKVFSLENDKWLVLIADLCIELNIPMANICWNGGCR